MIVSPPARDTEKIGRIGCSTSAEDPIRQLYPSPIRGVENVLVLHPRCGNTLNEVALCQDEYQHGRKDSQGGAC